MPIRKTPYTQEEFDRYPLSYKNKLIETKPELLKNVKISNIINTSKTVYTQPIADPEVKDFIMRLEQAKKNAEKKVKTPPKITTESTIEKLSDLPKNKKKIPKERKLKYVSIDEVKSIKNIDEKFNSFKAYIKKMMSENLTEEESNYFVKSYPIIYKTLIKNKKDGKKNKMKELFNIFVFDPQNTVIFKPKFACFHLYTDYEELKEVEKQKIVKCAIKVSQYPPYNKKPLDNFEETYFYENSLFELYEDLEMLKIHWNTMFGSESVDNKKYIETAQKMCRIELKIEQLLFNMYAK